MFATGGLGGVHREAQETWDESADLVALSRTAICVVCAGVKSILDVPATLERLETLGVARRRLRHRPRSPASTSPTPATRCRGGSTRRRRSPRRCARAREPRASTDALVVANPLPTSSSTRSCTSACSREALAAAGAQGVRGRDVTPFLLARFHEQTGGASLRANVRLVLRNAALAAQIAVAAAA